MHITLIRNPDRFADTGDEETLWEVRREAPGPGILRIPIGGVVPDFVEEVPLVEALDEDLAYEIAFTSEDGSAGFGSRLLSSRNSGSSTPTPSSPKRSSSNQQEAYAGADGAN